MRIYGEVVGYCGTKLEKIAIFTKTGNRYERQGFKEILYDRWVDNTWYDWEIKEDFSDENFKKSKETP